MSATQIVGALLVASPFVALGAVWVRDFGWVDLLTHLAALVALAAVIGVGLVLLLGGAR